MTDAVRLLETALAADGGGPELAADPSGRRDAALHRAVDAAWQAGDAAAVRALATGYGALLCLEPEAGSDGVRLVRVGIAERRRRGAFGTPAGLAAALARHALPCEVLSDNAFRPVGGSRPAVVDPACGSGALLRAAFERLLILGLPAAEAVAALHGVDDDPVAVHLARSVLAVDAVEAGAACTPDDLAGRFVVGDALLGATPLLPAAGVGLEWHRAFPAVLADPAASADPLTGWRGGFDAVVANPPWERLKVTRRDWQHRPPTALRADLAASARGLREAGRHPLTGSASSTRTCSSLRPAGDCSRRTAGPGSWCPPGLPRTGRRPHCSAPCWSPGRSSGFTCSTRPGRSSRASAAGSGSPSWCSGRAGAACSRTAYRRTASGRVSSRTT